MATVTIGKSYFEALLRRAEFHTSPLDVDIGPNLSHHVTLAKAEHDYLLQSERNYQLLKSALFRGGIANETLEILLAGESHAATASDAQQYDHPAKDNYSRPRHVPSSTFSPLHNTDDFLDTDDTESDYGNGRIHAGLQYGMRNGPQRDALDDMSTDKAVPAPVQRVPLHDQRTLLISNLPEHTTHKDLTEIIRGGRLLNVFLRNDRTATVSFVEGAADFLNHAKRTDIYLHMKRLEVRWADRQFHVPSHVSNKIANGATRNLVVRGAAGKLTAAQIRDDLDHIHNLIVIDIAFRNGDAFVSTNSIHNALFARTCMMSRTSYKGLRIEYTADECAASLPHFKPRTAPAPVASKPKPTTNTYAILDLDVGSDDSEDDSYLTEGLRVDRYHWADATAA